MSVHQFQEISELGYSRQEIRALISGGRWTKLRRDGYLTSSSDLSPEERHLHLLAATWPCIKDDSVVSHATAGLLWQLPVSRQLLDRVHVTRSQRSGGRLGDQLHLHTSRLSSGQIGELEGYRVTSLARTLVDLCRISDRANGLVAADAALRLAWDEPGQFTSGLAAAKRMHGIAKARWAIANASPLAESPAESISRYWMLEIGLPRPLLQYEVRDTSGRLLGRADFAWPELGVLGEVDGRVKYDKLLRPGETSADVVMREKSRENDFRQNGWWVYRWVPNDLRDGRQFAFRLARFLDGRTP